MRRYQGRYICLVLVIAMLSGCGGNAARDGDTGTDERQNRVTGTAISGQAIEPRKSKQTDTYKYCSGQYLYREYDNGVIQSRLDGTDEKRIRIRDDLVDFLEVNDGWLYFYCRDCEKEDCVVVRAPIESDEDGTETLNVDREETLLKEKGDIEQIIKIEAPNIVYLGEDYECLRYNWESGEKKQLFSAPESESNGWVETASNKNAYLSYDTGVYCLNWETGEALQVDMKKASATPESIVAENRYFLYSPYDGSVDVNVWKYDEAENKKECIVSWEETAQIVEQEMGLDAEKDIDLLGVTDLFYENERLYVQMQMNWWEGENYRWEYVLFSKELDADAVLRYEKELTECLRKHSGSERRTWKEDGKKFPLSVDSSQCEQMIEGKAFLSLGNEPGKAKLGCFELATGEFKIVGKNELEYYMGYYNETGYDVLGLEDESRGEMMWEQES